MAASLIFTRLFHLIGPIDDPHSWRQCDTANYALAFYADGINLLRPSVCWMGDYRTRILEFPLHEAVVALAYRFFGPHLFVARLVSYLFFLGSAWYLFRLVQYLYGHRLAHLTAVCYLALPLGQYYSRAIHIDFAAVCFAHAMLYYLVRAYNSGSGWSLLAATATGVLASLIKAPYAFYLLIPFGLSVATAPSRRAIVRMLPAVIVPIALFSGWRLHADAVNAASPDWFFIPGYGKFVDMGAWYFGSLAQRLDIGNWRLLWNRFFQEVVGGWIGLSLFTLGLIAAPREMRVARGFPYAWLLGTLVYVGVFFNLNVVHNYYQIPLLAITSFFVAQGVKVFFRHTRGSAFGALVALALLATFVATSVRTAESLYYQVDFVRERAGAVIKSSTDDQSLVITAMKHTGPFDPRLLYRAGRNGWSVRLTGLNAQVLTRLRLEGATHLAIVTEEPEPVDPTGELQRYPSKETALGEGAWRVRLYSLAVTP